jgi:hypothetical protein
MLFILFNTLLVNTPMSRTTKRSEGVHPESSSVHKVLIPVAAHNECIRDERTVTTPRHRFRICLAHTLPSRLCELVQFSREGPPQSM